jgi:hypothetical protein
MAGRLLVLLPCAIARLWLYPLLAILFYMHAILIFISVTGAPFR